MGTSDSGSRRWEGALWEIVEERWREALANGVLQPIETVSRPIEDQGIPFVVRVVERLADKPRGGDSKPGDPFAPPYDESLLVAEVPPYHVALLNKFPVIPEHLLLVTREFAEQEELLKEADFASLVAAMTGRETLGFYNGGLEAGASQPHKHLQVVPLPLGDEGKPVPLEPFLGRLPFLHAVADLKGKWPASASSLLATYHRLWRACGFELNGEHQPVPYNLLLTWRRMWLVPRCQESYKGIGVNALGFAGTLLAMDAEQLTRIEQIGPLTLLGHVALEGSAAAP